MIDTMNTVIMLQVRPYQSDGLSFTSSSGTRSMQFDGKDYPNVGPNATPGSAFSARRVSADTVEVAEKINGKITGTRQFKLSSDLKTLTMTLHTAGKDEPAVYIFERE